MEIRIEGSAKAIIKDLNIVNKKIQTTSTIRALNKTTDKVFTESVRAISAETGVPQWMLRGRKQSKATAKVRRDAYSGLLRKYRANRQRLKSRVWMGLLKTIPLRQLAKSPKQAAKFEKLIKKSLGGKSVSQLFEARMPSGKRGYYVRKTSKRFPIREARVSLVTVGEPIITRVGNKYGRKTFEKEFTRLMKVELKKKGSNAQQRS